MTKYNGIFDLLDQNHHVRLVTAAYAYAVYLISATIHPAGIFFVVKVIYIGEKHTDMESRD